MRDHPGRADQQAQRHERFHGGNLLMPLLVVGAADEGPEHGEPVDRGLSVRTAPAVMIIPPPEAARFHTRSPAIRNTSPTISTATSPAFVTTPE